MSDRTRALRRNLLLLDTVRSLRMALVAIPVVVLFWTESCGVGPFGVFMLQVVFSLTVTVLEVPSGYLSDRLGRRRTLLISSALALAGWIGYALSYSIVTLLAMEVVLALSLALWSGTDAAMLYETVQELELGPQALGRESRNLFLRQTTESVASILGGYLAVWVSLRATVWATVLPYAAICLLVLWLVEPARQASERPGASGWGWREMREALARPDLRLLVAAGGLLACGTLIAVWLHQLLWKRALLPLSLFGWAWAALNLCVALAALAAPALQARLGTRRTIGLMGLWSAASFVALGLWVSPWVPLIGCLLNVTRGVGYPIVITEINQRVGDDQRATILSVHSLAVRGIFCVYGPVIGWIAASSGLTAACVAGASLGLGAALVVVCFSGKLDP